MAIRKPSTAPKAPPAKARKVDSNKPKCDAVKTAVLKSPHLPASAAAMIAGMSSLALATNKSCRHQYQTDIVDMIGDVLRQTEATMLQSIAEKEEQSGHAVADKARRQEEKVKAEANLAEKKDISGRTQAAIASASKAYEAARTARKVAEAGQKSEEKKVQVASGRKKVLSEFQDGTLLPLKDGAPESADIDMKKVRKDVGDIGKEHKMEQVLLDTATVALQTKAADRGTFQEIALTQMAEAIGKLITECDEQIAAGETAKSSCDTEVNTAKEHEDKCKAELEARENEHEVAKHEAAAARRALTSADHAIANWIPDMRKLMDSLDKTKADLLALQKGALVYFGELEALAEVKTIELPTADASSSSAAIDAA